MPYALALFALCLPLTALIWQAGHLRRRMVWHSAQQEARREGYAAEQKLWEEAQATFKAEVVALRDATAAESRALEERVKRLEIGREPLKRSA